MKAVAVIVGLLLLAGILWDVFETVVLPRRVISTKRLARLYYRGSWLCWSALPRRMRPSARRENYLALYGPLSLLGLLALWAVCLIAGFTLLLWGLAAPLHAPEGAAGFLTTFYMSGTNFFTLGLGDVTPADALARAIVVTEAGTGFGFLGLVLSYLPVMYQAFSRREVNISLLDARAGSPPTAAALVTRNDTRAGAGAVAQFLSDWERWAAELLESEMSYPFLGYYRSLHENQSWVAALTVVLDTCALALVGLDGLPSQAARFTFAMARHAAVDLSQVYATPPRPPAEDRLPPATLARLRATLAAEGMALRAGPDADERLHELRALYEPFVNALADHFLMVLPAWVPVVDASDNWQATAWETGHEMVIV